MLEGNEALMAPNSIPVEQNNLQRSDYLPLTPHTGVIQKDSNAQILNSITALTEDGPQTSGNKLFSRHESNGQHPVCKGFNTPPNEIEPLSAKYHFLSEPYIPLPDIGDSGFIETLPPRCHCHIAAPSTYDPHAPASTRLRYLIKYSETIIDCPGVYDGLSARLAASIGFPGLYMTGAGTTASRLGAADLGIAQLHDMRTNAEMIANLDPDGPPLIADMDTGYGGPIVISKAVREYILAGVAGFHIEDQIMQKRCGHLAGKEVVEADIFVQRIKACKHASRKMRSDIVIIARTDALQSRGYDECISRLKLARDAGADMGIFEGFESKEQAAQAVRELAPWPLTLNSVENGVSPLITTQEAQAMGFRAIIFSFATISAAFVEVKKTLEYLKEHGATNSKVTPKDIFNACGLHESMEIDELVGGSAFKSGI